VVGPNPELALEGRRQAEARMPPNGTSIASVCTSEAPAVGVSGKGAGGAGDEPRRRAGNALAYAALDLGTNNCRLLIARPSRRGFQVIDAFSRIIRLGEGIAATGNLAPAAMSRTREALKACAAKIARQGVARSRLVATEACRVAANAPAFLDEINRDLGLNIEILSREDEAKLAVCGCASLLDHNAELALVFDIGGGSSELIWLDLTKRRAPWRRSLQDRLDARDCIAAWTSLPVGVVTLSERFGGCHVDHRVFDAMVEYVTSLVAPFEREYRFRDQIANRRTHLLGTSGTVTTLAGVWLGLQRYDRNRVDGCWLAVPDVQGVTMDLLGRTYEQRVAEPCIGRDRADLVLAGCAILEALLRAWPAERLRVADRGLREGILTTLMAEDGVDRSRERR
jgi:exopolyphosphatase/guanosine-5'-triphosphate,3'-diphosphate pyrophosphatase